jgi:hypothetical protein
MAMELAELIMEVRKNEAEARISKKDPFARSLEKTIALSKTIAFPKTVVVYSSLDVKIRKAQVEAAIARSEASTQCSSSSGSLSGDGEAPILAGTPSCRPERQVRKASSQVAPSTSVQAVHLLGCWKDSFGNTVCVHWKDFTMGELMATLTRKSGAKKLLNMWQVPDGSSWYCGNAVLSPDSAAEESQITWVFPDGLRSVWEWTSPWVADSCTLVEFQPEHL